MKTIKIFKEKFSQAWASCMICMVQGDITVLTLDHAITASKTGILTGLAYWLTIRGDGEPSAAWKSAWVTGVLTMVSDIVVHPSHFGQHWIEAFCTGLGAAVLCLIWEKSNGTDYSKRD